MVSKPFLRAQYYHDEAKKLRSLAESEEKASRRRMLFRIAESYDLLSRELFAEAKVKTDK